MTNNDNGAVIVSKAQSGTMMHRIISNIESIRDCDQATKSALLERIEEQKKGCNENELKLLNAYVIYTGELL